MKQTTPITAHVRKELRGYVGYIKYQGSRNFTESTRIVCLSKADAMAHAVSLRDYYLSLNSK